MRTITIESVDIIVERVSADEFKIKLGDLILYTTEFELNVGDTMTLNIPSMLVSRRDGMAQTVSME